MELFASRCCSASEAPCSCHVECARGLQALRGQGRPAGLIRLLECGPACACDTSCCPARPTQQGVTCELALFWHQQKVGLLEHVLWRSQTEAQDLGQLHSAWSYTHPPSKHRKHDIHLSRQHPMLPGAVPCFHAGCLGGCGTLP